MRVSFHDYELRPRAGLMGVRQGALLRVDWSAGRVGFADLHPWPEFGDTPLESHLEDLPRGELSPLVERALIFARVDAELRRQGRNAFLGLALPTSHRLVTNLIDVNEAQLAAWRDEGFTSVKVKLGRNLVEETERLKRLSLSSNVRWRLDFNGRPSVPEFTTWWRALSPRVRASIDFVEDPCAGELSIRGPWADDWSAQPAAEVRVVKPAREDVADVGPYRRIVFTHALDHTFGRACALWSAARHYQTHPHLREAGGLASFDAYQPDAFSVAWPNPGPRLVPTTGPGFGFGELLRELTWKSLT